MYKTNKQNKQSISLLTKPKAKAKDEDGCPICSITPHTPNFIKDTSPFHNEITNESKCECLNHCGDDPKVISKEVDPCAELKTYIDRQSKRSSAKVQLAVFIHNSPNGTLKNLLQDCLELI